jgi:hypothetical protein
MLPVHMNAGTEFGLDFNSRYIWRGFDLNPNNKPVLQPSVTFTIGDTGFSVNLWGSFAFGNKRLHEADITFSYDFSNLKDINLSIGFIHYGWYFSENFEFEDHTSQEVYLTLGLPKVPLTPTLSLYYDMGNGDGFYASLGIGHGVKLTESITLDLSASIGYNGGQWIEGSGFSNLDFGVSIPLKLDNVSISPFFGVVIVLLDEVNPQVDNEIFAGVSLAF